MGEREGEGAQVDEILATIRHDITSVETNLEESKAKLASDTDHATCLQAELAFFRSLGVGPGHSLFCRVQNPDG